MEVYSYSVTDMTIPHDRKPNNDRKTVQPRDL